MIVLMCR